MQTQLEKDKNIIQQYLSENNLDYKSTDSGIYYKIEKPGTGGHPVGNSVVNTHYKGYRLDGKVFDSSYERGEPIEFPLGNVIKGWQEAIPMLQKGGKGTFIIPSGIAYGAQGAGADIPPNTVLIFDVELLDHYNAADKAKRQAERDENIILDHLSDYQLRTSRTASGIHYVIEKEGSGISPTAADIVKVHYRGTLLNGKQFDSSIDRGEPITFPLNRVIKGWQESVPLLKEGGKGTFFIPSGLAYGERGAGADILPNSVLKFEVELIKVMNEEDMRLLQEAERKKQAEMGKKQAALDEEVIKGYIAANGIDAERTPEGVYYTVEVAGSDPKPNINSQVTVHYRGSLLTGQVFDSSFDRGQPATFPLNGVVAGWQIGIPQFGTGGKGRLIIPSGLAYGPQGAGNGAIPPNSVLIFDVEVIRVQ